MDTLDRHRDDPQWRDFSLAIYFALACPVARFILNFCVYQKLATWLIDSKAGHSKEKLSKDINQAKITKSMESMWKLTYYLVSEVFMFSISHNEPWFGDTDAFFNGWPNHTLKLPLKLYYSCQCGFYMYSIAALLVWETRRKDFSVMMSHHCITVMLLGYSYITSFFRIGSMILALHDMSDLIMELAKLCKYCDKELSASIFFGVFALSWLLLRLVYFPFWVIQSTSYKLVKYLDLSTLYHTWIYYFFNTMLITLLVFHFYWGMMICFMAKRQLQNRGKVGDDVRSDSEDED